MAVRITGAGVALTVGIIVVTGLIVGGFFWARQTADQARRDEAVKIAEEQLNEQSNDEVALNEGDENKDENQGQSSTNGSENGTSSESEGTIPSTGSDVNESDSVSELPQTGPAETLGSLLALGGLSFAVTAYLVSRQKLRDSL